MWRRTLKVLAVSYAVKTILLLGVWLAAPDLVRRGYDKAGELWQSLVGGCPPAVATPTAGAAAAGVAGTTSAPAPAR